MSKHLNVKKELNTILYKLINRPDPYQFQKLFLLFGIKKLKISRINYTSPNDNTNHSRKFNSRFKSY